MRRLRKDGRRLHELERELRARRAEPPNNWVRMLAERVRDEPRRLRPKARLALVFALVGAALIAAASAGGFSAAQATTSSAAQVIERLTGSSSEPSTIVSSAAEDQYKGKCGSPPRKKCKPDIDPDHKDVKEGNSGTTAVTFTVNLDAPSDGTVTVDWSTFDGSATVADSDYVPAGGTLVYAFGEKSKTITVYVNGDTKKEKDEDFFVRLTGGTNVDIGGSKNSQSRVHIQNDDK